MGGRTINTLVFDWDGTLADSAALGLVAFQQAFEDLGLVFSQEIYESTYSPNWYLLYEALGLPKHKWQLADELWLRHYGEQTADLIEGAAETILDLRRKGYRVGVVTSGSESRVSREIAQSGLGDIFETVICNEHIVNKKPHPEGLELALQRLKSTPEESAYVGDAPEDIQMGKRACVLTVGVRSSYPSSTRLFSSHPDIYLEKLSKLTDYF